MHYKHAPFEVNLVNLAPLEMIRLATALEGEDPVVVDPQVQLATAVVLQVVTLTSSMEDLYVDISSTIIHAINGTFRM